ncbi:MAG TPA: GNAT family N-acetyltransferase [Acidimicrobiales bacterium]|jgi:ribosomal protein S18 acetylase RimI-like enzyme|nr:GNAT family N-acetyltransferase [Acidimicrobiales bacterium]
MSDGDLIVRGYRPEDRPAVRRICHVTGYMGDPADWYWADEDSFADTWTGYYTDKEPESCGVVELDGEVVGYLMGCRDTRQADPPENIIGRHLIGGRHLLVRRGTAGFIWRAVGDIAVDAARRRLPARDTYDPRWPAHLHIDLLPVARGRGAGRLLMQRWLDRLRADGIAGCHLGTLAENTAGIAFFEAMGFRRHGGTPPVPGMRSPTGARHHEQLMVQELT